MHAGIERTYKVLMTGFLATMLLSSITPASALEIETISRRDLVIDLGNGLTTDAQLTFPAVGDGPFPGVLIIHGTGSVDMDGYLPEEATGIGEPVRHYLIIAEYLSERGFAVLRYNKRGVGLKGFTLDRDVVLNKTVQDLIQDAEKALKALIQQNEVAPKDITLIGRSEGSTIAPIVAIQNPEVKNIVLMGSGAHNLYDILYYQVVERNIPMFESIDTDLDGLTSIQEIQELHPTIAHQMIENSTGEWLWKPGFDLNEDGYFNVTEEIQPRWDQFFDYLNKTEFQGKWYQSHFALDSNLDIIGNVSASILILHGEEDQQGPVSEAFLLEQRLTDVGHPDHTLITYPGLGHTYYPVDRWLQLYGPPEEYVLSDLVTWIKEPQRDIRIIENQLQNASSTISALESQVDELNSGFEQQMNELQYQVEELRLALASSRNISYITLGIAAIALLAAIFTYQKRVS